MATDEEYVWAQCRKAAYDNARNPLSRTRRASLSIKKLIDNPFMHR